MTARRTRGDALDRTAQGIDRAASTARCGCTRRRRLGLHGIAVDEPGQVGPAWDQALAADRPTVLDVRTDPHRWGVLKEGLMTKAREILPKRSE